MQFLISRKIQLGSLGSQKDTNQSVKVKSLTYLLKPSVSLNCYLTIVTPITKSQEEGGYHIRLFDSETKQFFCYSLNHLHHAFESQLFEQLKNKNADAIWQMLLAHGDFVLECGQQAINIQDGYFAMEDLLPDQMMMLDQAVIHQLNTLGVGFVPSLYHWLIEPKDEKVKTLRLKALTQFTVFILHKVLPNCLMVTNKDAKPHEGQAQFIDADLTSLNQSIDSGMQIIPILASIFHCSEATILSFTNTSYKHLSEIERMHMQMRMSEMLNHSSNS